MISFISTYMYATEVVSYCIHIVLLLFLLEKSILLLLFPSNHKWEGVSEGSRKHDERVQYMYLPSKKYVRNRLIKDVLTDVFRYFSAKSYNSEDISLKDLYHLLAQMPSYFVNMIF